MTLKSFEYLIEEIRSIHEIEDKFYKMGLDLQFISDPYSQIITHIIKIYYGPEGEDWFSWFLYERNENGKEQAWDENGSPICYDIPSLWEHLEKIRKSEDFKEYSPPSEEEKEEKIKKLFSNIKNNGFE